MRHDLIEKMLRRVRKELDYIHSGMMVTRRKGEGIDFAELVPYLPGMNARNIYWNSLAKGGLLQSKAFFEEREVEVCIALFLEGSLRFGEPVEKFDKLLECAAWIAYSAQRSGNLCSGHTFWKDSSLTMPPSKNPASVERFIMRSGDIDPLYTALDMAKALKELEKFLRRRSLLFVAGDFLQIPDLSRLASRHAVVAVIIRDRYEASPEALGESLLIDPVSGEEAELLFDTETAAAYGRKYREHDAKLHALLRRNRIPFIYLYTDEKVASKHF